MRKLGVCIVVSSRRCAKKTSCRVELKLCRIVEEILESDHLLEEEIVVLQQEMIVVVAEREVVAEVENDRVLQEEEEKESEDKTKV